MRVGIFADSHDHLDHVRRAVAVFNETGCELVIFAGDFVSPLVVPPLRNLRCPVIACFGDNDGNKIGIAGGMKIVGLLAEPPFGFVAQDGTRFLITHQLEMVKGCIDGAQVIVFAHTHRPSEVKDASGRLFLNPGETGGWFHRHPTVMILETSTLETTRVDIDPEMATYPPEYAKPKARKVADEAEAT
jgi:putative phosphoesterase